MTIRPSLSNLRGRLLFAIAMALGAGLALSWATSTGPTQDGTVSQAAVRVGLALLVAAGVGLIGGELLVVRPARQLVAAATRLESGDLSVRTAFGAGPVELSQLARVLDTLAIALSDRLREVQNQGRALNRQARRFRALIEASSDGIALTDERGTLRYVSPATTRILGYAAAELVGTDMFGLIHPEDRDIASVCFTSAVAVEGEPAVGLIRLRHRAGGWRWIESTLTSLLEEPAVHAVVHNYRDVTESREPKEARLEA